jgi:hypothetical protein
VAEETVIASQSHVAPVYNLIPDSSELRNERVVLLEVMYCHIVGDDIGGEMADAGATLLARGMLITTQAAHHHYVILTLESGALVYMDKHNKRNIRVRTDKKGLNIVGDRWLRGEVLKSTAPTRWGGNVSLNDLVNKASSSNLEYYHLIDSNCQHFAEELYQFVQA